MTNAMNKMTMIFAALAVAALMTGCGNGFEVKHHLGDEPPVNTVNPYDGMIVKARTVYFVSNENGQTVAKRVFSYIIPMAYAANPTAIPISYQNAPNASMTVDSTLFVGPSTPQAGATSFGSLKITNLSDNNLKVCGANQNQKCSTAIIRMYTTGTAGAGLYNSAGGYGAPISAGLGTTRAVVGLASANSATVQSYTIPANDNKVTETDFAVPMQYNVDVDFSNAGAGSYSTTLVVEYGLLP